MGTDGVNGNKLVHPIVYGDTLTKIARHYNTTIEEILRLNPQIKNKDKIYAGRTLVVTDNKAFAAREDYNPNNMNLGTVSVGGEEVTELGGKPVTSNFFANNLAALSELSLNDGDSATKIVVEMQAGKSMTRKDNNTPYSILNKVLGDHLDNNSTVVQADGKRVIKSEWLENTDLYKAFISEDVNGDNFTGENNALVARGEAGNRVQLPAVEVDSNGVKYFTLHGENGVLYFDARGKAVTFEDGVIKGASTPAEPQTPEVPQEADAQGAPEAEEFMVRSDNNDKFLNVGKFYVNGAAVEGDLKSNFYANNVNAFMSETLNDESGASRLDVQLNVGSAIDARDTSATDILKKILGNNFDKASQPVENEGGYTLQTTALKDTDLYKAFVSEEVNGANFADGKIVRAENGMNMVQFPALEADENGVKYYVLHTSAGEVLYFNDRGEKVER